VPNNLKPASPFAGPLLYFILSGVAGVVSPVAWVIASVPHQSQAAAPDNGVTLFVSARDEKGHAITDLAPGEIRLWEDKIEQKIESFVPDSATPVLLAVLIDTSGSLRDKFPLKAETSALSELIHTGLRSGDAAIIATFDDEVHLRTQMTTDTQQLDQALRKNRGRELPWLDGRFRCDNCRCRCQDPRSLWAQGSPHFERFRRQREQVYP
jgi:VWFA-related protein